MTTGKGMRLFHYKFSWCDRTDWMLPEDELMYQNLFEIIDEWTERVMAHVPAGQRHTCIQAGGAMGLWPMSLVRYFDSVHTFEPHPTNYKCLTVNTHGVSRICCYDSALSDTNGSCVTMMYSKKVKNSYGAHWAKESDTGAPTMKLNQFNKYYDVNLIQLDVEGFELRVLIGGTKLIDEQRPVIVLEDRALPHFKQMGVRAGDAVRWLRKNFGYRVVDQLHGDKILVP